MRRIPNAVSTARIAAAVAALALGGCVSNGYMYDDPARTGYAGGGYYTSGGYYTPGSYYSGGNYYYPYGPQGYYVGNRWVSRPVYYNHIHHGDHCDHPSHHHGHDNDDDDGHDGHDGHGGNGDHDGQTHADGRGRDYLDRRGDDRGDRNGNAGAHTQGSVISNGQPVRGNAGNGRDYLGARGEHARRGGTPQVPVSSHRSGEVKAPVQVATPKEARVAPVNQPASPSPKAPLGRDAPDTARSDAAGARIRR
jgi:hypothetical protein